MAGRRTKTPDIEWIHENPILAPLLLASLASLVESLTEAGKNGESSRLAAALAGPAAGMIAKWRDQIAEYHFPTQLDEANTEYAHDDG